jgi:hypothetical protein
MNNISYKIYENNNDNNDNNDNNENNKDDNNGINFDDLINDIRNSICNDHKLALETDYNTNYNVKQLKQIITYYEIQLDKRNFKKKELINKIIIFELNNDNKNIVNKRKQLWFYMKQLKEDKCLNKFILFDI